jgi:hypothetical protein
MVTGKPGIRDKRSALDVAYTHDKQRIPLLEALSEDERSLILTMLRQYLKNFGSGVATALRGPSPIFALTKENSHTLIADLLVADPGDSFLLKTGKTLNSEVEVIMISENLYLLPLWLPVVSGADALLARPFFIMVLGASWPNVSELTLQESLSKIFLAATLNILVRTDAPCRLENNDETIGAVHLFEGRFCKR